MGFPSGEISTAPVWFMSIAVESLPGKNPCAISGKWDRKVPHENYFLGIEIVCPVSENRLTCRKNPKFHQKIMKYKVSGSSYFL